MWHPSWKNPTRVIHPMSATSLVFPSLLSLTSTLLLTIYSHVLIAVRHVESINKFHINQHQQTISRPGWRKFQLKWYILISATSLVFSSLLSLLSIVMLTTKPHDQKLGKWGIKEKDFWWTSKSSSLVVSGWGRVVLNQNFKIDCWLPFTISELAQRLSLRGP